MTKIPSVEELINKMQVGECITGFQKADLLTALTAERTTLLTELTQTIQAIDFYGWNEPTQSKIKEKVQSRLDELIKANSL